MASTAMAVVNPTATAEVAAYIPQETDSTAAGGNFGGGQVSGDDTGDGCDTTNGSSNRDNMKHMHHQHIHKHSNTPNYNTRRSQAHHDHTLLTNTRPHHKSTTDHQPALARGNMSVPPTQNRLLQTSEKTYHQAPRDMNPATHSGRKRVSRTGVSYMAQAIRRKYGPPQVTNRGDQ